MAETVGIHQGMQVYGSDGQPIGTVEAVRDNGIVVNGRTVLFPALGRVTEEGVYLRDHGTRLRTGDGVRQWTPPQG